MKISPENCPQKFPFSHCHCTNQSAYKSGRLSLLHCIARITASNLSDCRKNYILQKVSAAKKGKKTAAAVCFSILPKNPARLFSAPEKTASTPPFLHQKGKKHRTPPQIRFYIKNLQAVTLMGLSIKNGLLKIWAGPTLHHELEYLLDVLVSCSTVMVVPQLLLLLLWLVPNYFEVEAFPVGS